MKIDASGGTAEKAEGADGNNVPDFKSFEPLKKRFMLTRRSIRAGLIATTAALFLTACGATIDTEMNVSGTGAGERVMSLELPEDQVSELEGGVAAADASIRRYLPDWMSYSGLEETSEGSLKTVFTLPFESTADYEEKAAELLEREGQDGWNLDFTGSSRFVVNVLP